MHGRLLTPFAPKRSGLSAWPELNRIQHTQKIFQFEGLKEICVPDQSFVIDFDIFEGIIDRIDFVSSFLQSLVGSVNGCVSLHIFLHIPSNFGGFDISLLGPVVFYLCN